MAFTPAARAQDTVKWSEIRGLIMPAAVAATVPNSTVGSGTGVVPAAGLPWLTTQGSASINLRSGLLKFITCADSSSRRAIRSGLAAGWGK